MNDLSVIFVLVLGLLLMFFVMRRSRNGAPLFKAGGKKKNQLLSEQDLQPQAPANAQHNGTRAEVQQLVALVMRYAARHKMKLVFPGYVLFEGSYCRSTLLLAGPFGLLALRCYGYGGRVGPADSGYGWQQQMNGQTLSINNPLQVIQEDTQLLRRALEAGGFRDVPVQGIAVYTQSQVQLAAPANGNLFTYAGFKQWLKGNPLSEQATDVDLDALAGYLNDLVQQGQKLAQEKQQAEEAAQPETK